METKEYYCKQCKKPMLHSLKLIDEEGDKEAFIVCSRLSNGDYLYELSLCGENFIWSLEDGKINIETLNPRDLGFEISSVSDLMINNPKDGQDVFENVLKGNFSESDPRLLTIALNTGALLYLSKKAKSLKEGLGLALLHIKSGKVWEHFQNFLNCSKRTVS
jgi:anthranilate phosphoribosyltransferase